ncbi:DUF2849 domain-containing protein [Phaeobacter inhibens]|uniref:DUF2849 domain-containing protein n=1 Tax=Phaeobacter inhibens TaxID=221822 RepID=UPI0021A59244|nr:DUF2849 domain-containing protein [Phaeobacter inhibens]UWR91004.1 DUF2849 domain-containing protein [Phaeobacter inhibens]
MPRPFTPKIITANDLLEGDVIYFTDTNGWSRELREAELIEDEAEAQLRLLEAEKDALHVVGIYLTDAKAGANGPEPTHFREDFRRTGPSNYRHGKQEAAANV